MPFGFIAPKTLNYLAFQVFDFERTWWRLFWAYLMKVILSIPDEGYFEHTWWRLFWAYLMKVILSVPDDGYSRIVRTKFDIYVSLQLKTLSIVLHVLLRFATSHYPFGVSKLFSCELCNNNNLLSHNDLHKAFKTWYGLPCYVAFSFFFLG